MDGSISGPPPTVRPGARLYLSGPRAAEVADLRWTHASPVVVGDRGLKSGSIEYQARRDTQAQSIALQDAVQSLKSRVWGD